MIVAKYYCDICKKEIKSRYHRIEIGSCERNINDSSGDRISTGIDLCLDCKEGLELFLNRKL